MNTPKEVCSRCVPEKAFGRTIELKRPYICDKHKIENLEERLTNATQYKHKLEHTINTLKEIILSAMSRE